MANRLQHLLPWCLKQLLPNCQQQHEEMCGKKEIPGDKLQAKEFRIPCQQHLLLKLAIAPPIKLEGLNGKP